MVKRTDSDHRTAVSLEDRLTWERQLVAFGMALASKEARRQLKSEDFASSVVGYAFEDLGPRPTEERSGLKYLLSEIGVGDWDIKDGNPGSMLLEHVRLDARFQVMINDIAQAFGGVERARNGTASQKISALKHAEKAVDEAYRVQQAAKASKASVRQEAASDG